MRIIILATDGSPLEDFHILCEPETEVANATYIAELIVNKYNTDHEDWR